jgi:hypothetical protein
VTVAYVEIEHEVLVCPCGRKTEVPGNGMSLVAQPRQQCARSKKVWWTPAAGDCTPGRPDHESGEGTFASEVDG